jgi:flagellar hook protein FlgE
MSFQQGLSGLNSSAKQLDVIGNNVANSGTVGFKQSQTQFADMYAASLSGGGAVQIGTGGKVAAVMQQFTQGNITNTSNPMDTAISGQGFFRMIDQSGSVLYSRNGQFQVDKNGFVVNNQGHKLSGYLPDATGAIIPGQPLPIQINASDLSPHMTANVVVGANLDSRSATPINPTFSTVDPTSYNSSTSLTVYDSLGASHVGSLYFQRQAITPTTSVAPISAAATTAILVSTTGMAVGHTLTLPGAGAAGSSTNAPGIIAPGATSATLTSSAGLAIGDNITIVGAGVAGADLTTTITSLGPGANVVNFATATTTATLAGAAVTSTKALTVTLTGIVGTAVTFTPATTTATLANATISSNAGSPNWNTYLAIDGVLVPAVATPLTQLTFDTLGKLASTTPVSTPVGTMVSAAFTPTGAASQTLSFNFATTSQYGGSFGVNSLTQDGYSSGRLSGFNTSADGTILGRYSNGQSRALGQVLLANFTNPQGLQPMGNNEWVESATSGGPLVGTPGSSALGVLQSSAVEDSNVDLTAELVNMITAQRVYQANAQTIKAQDQVLQTLVNLR